jgi:hypothetical protein
MVLIPEYSVDYVSWPTGTDRHLEDPRVPL